MIPQWASSGPPLIAFLFCVVFFRAQGTYWLGRAAAHGALSSSGRDGVRGCLARWFDGPAPRRGAALLNRWGLFIIPLCFLTVGIQTAVNAGAGLVRMPWRTYTIAMLPGCLAWALMYGLGLLAVWTAAVSALTGSVPGQILLGTALAGVSLYALARHLRKRTDSVSCAPPPVLDTVRE